MAQAAIPGIQLPSFELPQLQHLNRVIRGTADEEEENDLIAAAAEHQIQKERQPESDFWKFMELLIRPQHAVAGVLKDLVDGGDFSPIDRVGKALAGEEKYGIKDVLDVLFPGRDPKLFSLPEWLGGKDVGVKGLSGFVGDIITDPLMWIGFFRLGGQFARMGGETQRFAAKWVPVIDGAERARVLQIDRAMAAQGVTHNFQAAFVRNRENIAYFNRLFKDMVEDPERFKTRFLNEEDAFRFMKEIEPYRNFKWASPTIREQFANRERYLLSLRLPFAKYFGVKDISMLPFLDQHLGTALADGIDAMYRMAGMSEKIQPIRKWLKGLFQYSTGIPMLDHVVMTATANEQKIWEDMLPLVNRFQDALKSHWTKEDARKIVEYSLKRKENFGLTMRKIPEEYRESVDALTDLYAHILRQESNRSLIEKSIQTELFVDKPAKAAEKFFDRLKWEANRTRSGALHFVPKYESWEGYVKEAEEEVKKYTKQTTLGSIGIPEHAPIENALLEGKAAKLLQADMAAAARILGDSLALTYDSYMPRILSPKARELFGTMLESTKFQGQPAMEYFTRHFAGRKWQDVSMMEINRAVMEGKFPQRFMEAVFESYRKALGMKSKKARKTIEEFLREIGPEHSQFFIEDPVMQASHRIRASLRAITEHDRDFQIIAITGRRWQVGQPLWIGERVYLPSPEGMKAIMGSNWREKLSDLQLKAYDTIAKRYELGSGSGIHRLMIPMDNLGVVQGDVSKLPLFAYPDEVLEAIEKFSQAARSKENWGLFMRSFEKLTQWWKSTTLAIFPGYHARNIIGNMWQAFLGGTLHLQNYKDAYTVYRHSGETGRVLRNVIGRDTLAAPDRALEDVAIKAANGITYTGEDILRIARNGDLLGGSFFRGELGVMGEKGIEFKKKGITRRIFEQATPQGIPIKAGFAVGQTFENMQRIAHLIGRLRLGDTPYEAIRSVKKFFFDYKELSTFEKNVLRNIFPFYSWTRKNIPLQMEMMIRQPGKYAQLMRAVEFVQSDEGKKFDRKLLPRWVSRNFGVPLRVNKYTGDVEVSILKYWIPAAELVDYVHTNPVDIATGAFEQSLALLNPFMKSLLEQGTNLSFYTRRPIEEVPGESIPFLGHPRRKRVVHLLKNVRLLSEIDRLVYRKSPQGELDFATRLWNAMGIAPKIRAFDVERLKNRYKFDVIQRQAQLKRMLNRAKRDKDKDLIRYLKDMIENAAR